MTSFFDDVILGLRVFFVGRGLANFLADILRVHNYYRVVRQIPSDILHNSKSPWRVRDETNRLDNTVIDGPNTISRTDFVPIYKSWMVL